MSEKKYDIIQITKDFLARHKDLGYVQAYYKYLSPDFKWYMADGRVFPDLETAMKAITIMDTVSIRPYADIKVEYIGIDDNDENSVLVYWSEATFNKDTGRAIFPYSITGPNPFEGMVLTKIKFKDGAMVSHTSYFDRFKYAPPATLPMSVFSKAREEKGFKYEREDELAHLGIRDKMTGKICDTLQG